MYTIYRPFSLEMGCKASIRKNNEEFSTQERAALGYTKRDFPWAPTIPCKKPNPIFSPHLKPQKQASIKNDVYLSTGLIVIIGKKVNHFGITCLTGENYAMGIVLDTPTDSVFESDKIYLYLRLENQRFQRIPVIRNVLLCQKKPEVGLPCSCLLLEIMIRLGGRIGHPGSEFREKWLLSQEIPDRQEGELKDGRKLILSTFTMKNMEIKRRDKDLEHILEKEFEDNNEFKHLKEDLEVVFQEKTINERTLDEASVARIETSRNHEFGHLVFEVRENHGLFLIGFVFPIMEEIIKLSHPEIVEKAKQHWIVSEESLNLSAKGLSDVSLLEGRSWLNLTCLNLSENSLFEGLSSLVRQTFRVWPNIQDLDLSGNQIDNVSIYEFCQGYWDNLKTLTLWFNRINQEGINALANLQLISLEMLQLNGNYVHEEGAQALAKAGKWPRLSKLNLYKTSLGDTGIKILFLEGSLMSQIRHLNLEFNVISHEGIKFMAMNDEFVGNVVFLNLGNNPIGEKGAKNLIQKNWPSLQTLNLINCGLGKEGAEVIYEGSWPALKTIRLEKNGIPPNFHILFREKYKQKQQEKEEEEEEKESQRIKQNNSIIQEVLSIVKSEKQNNVRSKMMDQKMGMDEQKTVKKIL